MLALMLGWVGSALAQSGYRAPGGRAQDTFQNDYDAFADRQRREREERARQRAFQEEEAREARRVEEGRRRTEAEAQERQRAALAAERLKREEEAAERAAAARQAMQQRERAAEAARAAIVEQQRRRDEERAAEEARARAARLARPECQAADKALEEEEDVLELRATGGVSVLVGAALPFLPGASAESCVAVRRLYTSAERLRVLFNRCQPGEAVLYAQITAGLAQGLTAGGC